MPILAVPDEAAEQTVRELHSALGRDPRTIAVTLFALGIKGIPSSGKKCPIAIYLESRTPVGWRVRNVHPAYTMIEWDTPVVREEIYCPSGKSRRHICVSNPEPIGQFIRLFDFGYGKFAYLRRLLDDTQPGWEDVPPAHVGPPVS